MSNAPDSPSVRVLVADSISDEGIELLRGTPGFEVEVKIGMKPEELREVIGSFDAMVVRSATKVRQDALASAGRLRAIGRAGTGVDNIDLAAATRAGIVVMNTPGGNSVAAAELTLAHLLALARNLPQANSDLRQGKWERKKYMGVEVAGKTLGVVGLGRIGREVARRAQGLRMEVLGFDPYVSSDLAADHGIRYATLEDLLAQSDFVTLHLPLSPETKHMIGADALGRMKPGARLINCARGGLIDEQALLDALQHGRLAGVALDVFEAEPPTDRQLLEHPLVVATPHLGASTVEAQQRVGTEIAEKVRDYLRSGLILDAVNFPSIGREDSLVLGPIMSLAERLGSFLAQVAQGGFKRLEVRTLGTFGETTLKPIGMAAAKGLLTPVLSGGVTMVNALGLAEARGITIDQSRSNEKTPYAGLLRLSLETDKGNTFVCGTLIGTDLPRLVEVDGVSIESTPDGEMLFVHNRDVPGVVGQIGTILGQAGVNIAGIHLGRRRGGTEAVSIIDVDTPVPAEALARIQGLDEILWARTVKV